LAEWALALTGMRGGSRLFARVLRRGVLSQEPVEEGVAYRRGLKLTVAAGLTIAAVVMLLSILFLRSDRPVLWPPASKALYSTAFVVVGTALMLAVYAALYLVINLVAAALGKRPWREFLDRVVFFAVALVVVGVSLSVSTKAFYWPWAKASALETILSNRAKWRIAASAETLAAHWDTKVEAALETGLSDRQAAVRANAAYALAAAGRKEYLHAFAEAASAMLAQRADGAEPTGDNDVASQADAVWLVARLADSNAATLAEFDQWLAREEGSLRWDAAKKRYLLTTRKTP